jgi:chorismate mutase
MPLRGIRGATVVQDDQPEIILAATRDLLEGILQANPTLQPGDLASVLFTVTDDIRSVYPARAARDLGWTEVPLLCMREIPVPGGMERCVRVLLHWNTDLSQAKIHHVYQGKAASLRPDLSVVEI